VKNEELFHRVKGKETSNFR